MEPTPQPCRWTLLPQPAEPFPWIRRDARVRTRIALFLLDHEHGATIAQMAEALDLSPYQVRMAVCAMRAEGYVRAIGRVQGNHRPQGGGRGRTLYAWSGHAYPSRRPSRGSQQG